MLRRRIVEQIKYSMNNELVSSDIVGNSSTCIYDSNANHCQKTENIVLYIWYDNEYGYSHQVIRLAKYIAKVRRYTPTTSLHSLWCEVKIFLVFLVNSVK
jgi:glyceraldehyde 3-phosphate dehydrogenase